MTLGERRQEEQMIGVIREFLGEITITIPAGLVIVMILLGIKLGREYWLSRSNSQ